MEKPGFNSLDKPVLTEQPRQYEAIIAPNLPERLSFRGEPRTAAQNFELTVQQARDMAPDLVGKPMRVEHFNWIDVGRVNASWVDSDHNWRIKYELWTHKKPASVVAATASDLNIAEFVSLSHNRRTMKTYEVTLCNRPGRPGARIIQGKIDIPPELISPQHKALKVAIDNICSVKASSPSEADFGDIKFRSEEPVYLGSDLVIATDNGELPTQEEYNNNNRMSTTTTIVNGMPQEVLQQQGNIPTPPIETKSGVGAVASNGINGLGVSAPQNGSDTQLQKSMHNALLNQFANSLMNTGIIPAAERHLAREAMGLPPAPPPPQQPPSASPPPPPPQAPTKLTAPPAAAPAPPPPPPPQPSPTNQQQQDAKLASPPPQDAKSKIEQMVKAGMESGDPELAKNAEALIDISLENKTLQQQLKEAKQREEATTKRLYDLEAATASKQFMDKVNLNARGGLIPQSRAEEIAQQSRDGTFDLAAAYAAQQHRAMTTNSLNVQPQNSYIQSPVPPQQFATPLPLVAAASASVPTRVPLDSMAQYKYDLFLKMSKSNEDNRGPTPPPSSGFGGGYSSVAMPPPPPPPPPSHYHHHPHMVAAAAPQPPRQMVRVRRSAHRTYGDDGDEKKGGDEYHPLDESKDGSGDDVVRASAPIGQPGYTQAPYNGYSEFFPGIYIGPKHNVCPEDGSKDDQWQADADAGVKHAGWDAKSYNWEHTVCASAGGATDLSRFQGSYHKDNQLSKEMLMQGGGMAAGFGMTRGIGSAHVTRGGTKGADYTVTDAKMPGEVTIPPYEAYPPYRNGNRICRISRMAAAELEKGMNRDRKTHVDGIAGSCIPERALLAGPVHTWTGRDDHRDVLHQRGYQD